MLTPNERIGKLEEQVVELRRSAAVAGSLAITVAEAVLDQMVDEQLLPAATRTEIFGRIRKELSAVRIGSEDVYRGASASIPRYQTIAERTEANQHDDRIRKELLQIRQPKPSGDQSPDTQPATPERK